MMHQRIISPALLRQRNETKSAVRGEERVVHEISFNYFIAPVFLLVVGANYKDLIHDYIPCHWMYMLVIFLAISALITTISHRRPRRNKYIEAIVLYPLGIQMGTIPNDGKTTLIPQQFLHRETIVDCVVTELVYSYKVQSAVVIRTKKRQYDESKAPATTGIVHDDLSTNKLTRTRQERESVNTLIRLFSDVEMTYMECLTIRSQINCYLKHFDKITLRKKGAS